MMEFKYKHMSLHGKLESEITYTIYNKDGGLNTIMQEFRRFLLAVSFHSDAISEYIEEE